ncbi:MAG: Coenzyme F420 hydrogenase/dehydrogenase, beta subunit C-terminal domain [Lachnospiraceae bacterium]|nr:Coenzyme F420 hydrogenase/dehydrogenase, beta subunit C-terminal domain [Lachnospiraceae bacterium]
MLNNSQNDSHKDNNSNVAILGRYNNANLGGKLTVLSTYSTVTELGFNATILRLKEHDDNPELIYNKLCKFTKDCVNNPEPPSSWNNYFDNFLLCSDWTFSKTWFLPLNIRLFDWVKDGKNIISFAASFGTATGGYLESDYPLLAKQLNRFTSLSIREQTGVEMCKKIGAVHAEQVADPVFSQRKDFYLNIANLSVHKTVGYRYAAVYLLDMNAEAIKIAIKTAKRANLIPFFVIAFKDRELVHLVQDYDYASVGQDGVSDWLYYLNNADYIITNSFHGLCMSYIFGKNFSVIDRKGFPNVRVKSILTQFGTENKFILTEEDISTSVESAINMPYVNLQLDEMYKKTREFVINALNNKKNDNKKVTCTDLLSRDLCTGCFACVYSCPKNCIVPDSDKKSGFIYPQIKREDCINCGLCAKVCPILQNKKPEKENTYVYCGYSLNKEIRYKSTSGGFFTELALSLLEKGNTVVFGAAYETPFKVCHIEITSPEDLPKIRQSKYVQSEICGAYPKIENHLNMGRTVMFCGTPCQCAAVKQYMELKRINTEKLYLVDFICHSVNSPYAYSAYLHDIEHQYGKTIKQVWFKNKEKSWKQFSTRIDFNNSDNYYLKDRYEDSFYKGFLKYHLFSRPSCMDCQFKGMERISDITLADAWGINMQSGDDCHGISTAILHSEKGKELFDSIENKIYCEEKTMDMVTKGNVNLNNSVKPGQFSDYFYQRLAQKIPFSQIIEEIDSGNLANGSTDSDTMVQNPYPNVVVNGAIIRAHPTAQIIVQNGGELILNYGCFPCSNAECFIDLREGAKLLVNGTYKIYYSCRIVVHKNATLILGNGYMNTGTKVISQKSITIGDAYIGPDCYIIDSDYHRILDKEGNVINPPAPVKFDGHVWLGQNVTILKGVTIGKGSCIGAKSLVTKDIPPNCLAAGNPARIIKSEICWE